MIPRIHQQGSNTLGLLHYLYGRGTHEEHIDPHLVASFDTMAPDPGRDLSVTKKDLQHLLDQPLSLLGSGQRPDKHVWHCSVRAAPDDPILSDEQWAEIARRMVAATGIDPGDGAGCRWAAVRHATDHIHIIATLIREDGRRPDHHRSGKRAQAEARLIEAEYGLHRVTPGDGTAAKRPTSAERHKAERQGRERTVREELRETVRRAVAGAATEAEFFDRLKAAGLLVRTSVLPSGDLRGYTVAMPGDRNKDGEPVFYAGSTLAPDLSLPRIRDRFDATDVAAAPDSAHPPQRSAPSAARRTATHAAWAALLVIDHGDDGAVAAQITATGEVLDVLAKTSALHTRQQLREAAWAFERASRSHTRAEFRHSQQLRRTARDLVHSGPALGRGEDSATTAMVIDTLFFLALAAAHWHAQRQHAQQAAAARQAATHLQAAYAAASEESMARLRAQGLRLAQPVRNWSATLLCTTAPQIAERVLGEPGWPALAVTITHAYQAGHDPRALLHKAVAQRELHTAESASDVLVWRLRRMADLPANVTVISPHSTRATDSLPYAAPLGPVSIAVDQHRRHRR
ncbi:relaxase/mobilization nuclease domain-containing protein [Streptomyces hirsutus]|uniref:Relaxase/mobilization nuclease domain-containing protein n=1 Tax=Streptomyces hirsutus TaxID=35620 RepID=A0ABZ1GPA7_9ACTN|nr:relaxase/mobilization nuclease domain-containing protein [Streptomyces hirsutus]WSD07980.1 relaxase/mobilization nuclease domain-containing protein [Streptomyces hirsutus]